MEITAATASKLRITEEEFEMIKEKLGRTPNFTELCAFSGMWSEHCSYKNSIKWLKTLPRDGGRMLVAAGEVALKHGNAINVKKGQGIAPWDMKNVAEKIASTGCDNILLTERGASFGYNALVSDMRSLPIMAKTGYPVVFDATHSVQMPSGQGGSSGGDRTMVPYLARAAVAAGVAGVFMETHQDPDNAPSDGPCMVKLHEMRYLLEQLKEIDAVVKR
jgi:2-dehydro-3-deoxyphosphooctonate aldolase (KDO 8-P synthase)